MTDNLQQRPIKAILADDESLSRDLVNIFLKKWPQVQVVAECSNGLSAVNSILKYEPAIVFLDIQMPDLNGFEVLKEIGEAQTPQVIFITAYDNYAIKAFDASAADYLLKPINQERFDQAMVKVLKRLEENNNNTTSIRELLSAVRNSVSPPPPGNFLTRILIKEGKKLVFLKLGEVDWIEASGDYAKIHSNGKTALLSMGLTELDKKLDPAQFIRIHRSTIVNIDFIKELHPYSNGEFNLVLKNEQTVRLSRSFKDRLKPYLNKAL